MRVEVARAPAARGRVSLKVDQLHQARLHGRALRHGWKEVGDFLGGSIRSYWETYPADLQLELWEAAGIDDAELRRMSLGGGVVMWGRTR